MPPQERCVPPEPDGVVAGGQQRLERPLQSPLGVSAQALDVAQFPLFQEKPHECHVVVRKSEPEDSELPYLLRRGISFRQVIQTPAVRRHAVAGGLSREGLAHWRQAQELGPGDGMHVHHRNVALPCQEFPEYLLRPFGAIVVRGYGREVHVGVGAVLADGAGPSQYDFRRAHLVLDLPGYGQAFGSGALR